MKILLTGTTAGVGLELAKMLLAIDHTVVGYSRSPSVIDHNNYIHYIMDFSMGYPVLEGMDIIINNAGITDRNYIEDQSIDLINRILFVNLITPIQTIKACNDDSRKQLFINVLSGAATEEFRKLAVYSTAKAGLHKFSKCLVKDFQDKGISDKKQVVNFYPGPINTSLCPNSYKDGRVKLLEPQEVAASIMDSINEFINTEVITDFYKEVNL